MVNRAEFSVLIGGKAGEGINQAGSIIAHLFNDIGYRVYVYFDYPSLIRGGHNFSIIRASTDKIETHKNKVDFILALNQDCVNLHKERLGDNSVIIYDSDAVKAEGSGFSLTKIVKEENAAAIMRNSCIIGCFCKSAGISWDILEGVFRKNIDKEIELNLKLARRGYDEAKEKRKIEPLKQKALPILTGNEAIGLGLVKGGLKNFIAYPMTPTSGILHFLAQEAERFSIKVIHPENEIGVILMALGFSYMGEKTAVGTSGGGFCLMTEGLSFSGMAELPVVIVVGQRPGPSTGLPTYTCQSELHFALNAGQGEFVRFVTAPGDAEEAYFWSSVAMNMSWKYQIPSIVLSDKTLSEGIYTLDIDSINPSTLPGLSLDPARDDEIVEPNAGACSGLTLSGVERVNEVKEESPALWDGLKPYKRYLNTETGVSPLAFAGRADAIVKVNSYEHDEAGITSEDAGITKTMQDKRLRKEEYLNKELEKYNPVKVYGNKNSKNAILCWGSNKGVCIEAADKLGLKVIQPLVLSPFPSDEFRRAISGVKKLISVENNATGQLAKLINCHGFKVDGKILKYDGRPFSLEELESKMKEIAA